MVERNNNNSRDENTKRSKIAGPKMIVIAAIAAIAVVVSAFSLSASTLLNPEEGEMLDGQIVTPQQSAGDVVSDENLRKGRPPMKLESWGPKYQSFEEAKSASGLANAFAPSYIPSELNLDSVRVQSGNGANFMTAFYASKNDTTKDSDSFQDFMKNGGIAIVYMYDPPSETFDRDEWIERYVSEAPDGRHIETINGKPAIVSEGFPDQEITYQVVFYSDDVLVDLISLKYTDTELVKVAESFN